MDRSFDGFVSLCTKLCEAGIARGHGCEVQLLPPDDCDRGRLEDCDGSEEWILFKHWLTGKKSLKLENEGKNQHMVLIKFPCHSFFAAEAANLLPH
jgi:hypothetical protein